MAENFPNLAKETDIKVQEAKRVLKKMNLNRPTPRHIIIQMSKVKDKERILKAARKKQLVIYKGIPVRLSADFSAETLQARTKRHDIFKVLKGKNLQQRILYLAKLSFRTQGQIKSFSDKHKLRHLICLTRNVKETYLRRKERP